MFIQFFWFLESFATQKFCRFCEATKEEAQSSFMEDQLKLRTRETYEKAVSQLSDPSYDSSATGIKEACCLHELQYFHASDNWASDIMHDLLEGVVPCECCLLFHTLNRQKLIIVQGLNAALRSSQLTSCNKNSKLPFVRDFNKLNIKAA